MPNKGSRYERQLVNRLNQSGISAFRIPASGSGHDRPSPDVFVHYRNNIAIELKFVSSDWAYITEDELKALQEFSEGWDATGLAVARFSGDTDHYCIDINGDMEEYLTSSGNLSIKRKNRDEYDKLSDYVPYD